MNEGAWRKDGEREKEKKKKGERGRKERSGKEEGERREIVLKTCKLWNETVVMETYLCDIHHVRDESKSV